MSLIKNNIKYDTIQGGGVWLVNITRVSDGHHLDQLRFSHVEPSDEDLQLIAEHWETQHPDSHNEPDPTLCRSCGKTLIADTDTNYQFDNALWIGFHGGYGMFVDSMADFPTNTGDQWRYKDDSDPVKGIEEDPDWVPEYAEPRVLPGRPDHEAVICHQCAHDLCEKNPWINDLLEPLRSHSHRSAEIPQLKAEGHRGWDLDRGMHDE